MALAVGVVNLLAPRSRSQRPYTLFWNEHFTHTELRYDFINHDNGDPELIPRTFGMSIMSEPETSPSCVHGGSLHAACHLMVPGARSALNFHQ